MVAISALMYMYFYSFVGTLQAYCDMDEHNKCKMLLSWFVGSENASLIVSESEEPDTTMLPKSARNLPDSIRDSIIATNILKKFAKPEFISHIDNLVAQKQRSKQWKCGICKKNIANERCIACDRCLMWNHFSCTKLKKKPHSNWFCTICIEDMGKLA